MDTIGFIGADPINGLLAHLSVKVGYSVIVSDEHGAESVRALASSIGPSARGCSAEECAAQADVSVIAVSVDKFGTLPAAQLKGKTVVDTCNYYPQIDGHIAELDSGEKTSSELLRDTIGANVVKAFYNLDRWHLSNGPRPFGDPDRWALPICGDDEVANAIVARWMGMIGFDPVYCGTLAESWRVQAGTSSYVLPYVGFPPASLTKEERRIWYRWDRSMSVKEEDIKRFAAAAQRNGRPYGLLEDLPSGLLD